MAIRDTFTDEEWFLLGSTPGLIGAAVSAAGRSGIGGTLKEALVSVQSLMEGAKEFPDNDLIQGLLAKTKDREAAKADFDKYRAMALEKMKGKNPAEITEQMLTDCQAVATLLSQKSPTQATAYKTWALEVAEKVAKASREGGFLGFGGEQVSAEEKMLIEKIKTALAIA